MAWVVGSSRSAVKELAFSSSTIMSRWISSRNWRNSNPFSSGRDRLELDLANSPLWQREIALREKMAPSETVMAPNTERGKKKRRVAERKKEREMKMKNEERENIVV
jgi:hypothetical protein